MRIGRLVIVFLFLAACHWPRKNSDTRVPTPLEIALPSWTQADTSLHANIPIDNPTTVEGAALGRKLFYDKTLSADGSLSCASCHVQAFAFSDPAALSRGMGGAVGQRNAPPLMNLAFGHFFFWDARALSLELQAFEPVRGHAEMASSWHDVATRLKHNEAYPPLFVAAFGDRSIDSMRVAFALAQFERTLISLDSKYDRSLVGESTLLSGPERRGRDLFFSRAHCVDCHEPPLFSSHVVANIGLDDPPIDPGMGGRTKVAWHLGRFKTPSLRNIAVTAPYMHDGRFATLEQVIDFYADGVKVNAPTLDAHMQPWVQGEVKLSTQDRADLAAFLRTLSDEHFLTEPTFGAPH